MSKVVVIGGGAAGMFASVFAARNGNEVHLFEKNEKTGKKLFITGKGRCNITNAGDMETLFRSVVSNPKFLYSSFYGYTNEDVISFFEEIGVKTKIERGNRVSSVRSFFGRYQWFGERNEKTGRKSSSEYEGEICRRKRRRISGDCFIKR